VGSGLTSPAVPITVQARVVRPYWPLGAKGSRPTGLATGCEDAEEGPGTPQQQRPGDLEYVRENSNILLDGRKRPRGPPTPGPRGPRPKGPKPGAQTAQGTADTQAQTTRPKGPNTTTVRLSHWMRRRRGGPGDPPAAKARRPRDTKDCLFTGCEVAEEGPGTPQQQRPGDPSGYGSKCKYGESGK
jgi:hypothetical protein